MVAITEAPPPSRAVLSSPVIGLLALVVFINYVDRGNLATAAPLIKDQLKLSSTQIGLLVSAFFWSYTPSQILAGWLAERINAYRTLALGLALWSLGTIGSGFATGFWTLIALRLLLGLGESAAFPCSSKLFALHLPSHRLGGANGWVAVGLALGPAFGTFVGGLLMARLDWRPVFILFGLASLAWLWPWMLATQRDWRRPHHTAETPEPSFADILRRREFWGAGLGHFCSNYTFYFVIFWLPLYLVKARGFSVSEMGEIGGLIYLLYAASSFITGWLSDRAVRAGASANSVRKTAGVASQLVTGLAMAGCALGDARASMASLFLAGIAFGLNTPTLYAAGQTLAGPFAAGKWVGMQNCLGNLAGILGPIVTGLVVDQTGEFYGAFVIAAAIAVAGATLWGLAIRRIEPIDWFAQPGSQAGAAKA